MTHPKHAFVDRAGRTWLLVLNFGLAKRINGSLGVDFNNAHTGECFKQLAASDELLVATLFAIVEEQATIANVTPEQFAEACDGAVFEAAGEALGEMIKVFTRPGIRPVIESMLARGAEGRNAAIEMAANKLNSPAVTALIERELAKLDRELDDALSPSLPAGVPASMATSSPTSGPPSPA